MLDFTELKVVTSYSDLWSNELEIGNGKETTAKLGNERLQLARMARYLGIPDNP